MKEYKWTFTGFALAIMIWSLVSLFDIDVFETVSGFLTRFETFELDELLFPVAIIYVFAMADLSRRLHNHQLAAERLKIHRKMMKAVQHILNNFLQKMLLFKMTAEDTKDFDPNVLNLYDRIIAETSEQIDVLGSIQKPDEESIEKAIRLDKASD